MILRVVTSSSRKTTTPTKAGGKPSSWTEKNDVLTLTLAGLSKYKPSRGTYSAVALLNTTTK